MRFFLVLCVLVLTLGFPPFSRHGNPAFSAKPSSPFDSYGNLCWEDEKARLDNFAIAVQNAPTVTGEIIVFAGKQSCSGEAKYRGNRARNWVLKRGVASKQVVVIEAGFYEKVTTYLIIRPQGSDPYDLQPTLPKKEVSIKRCVDKVFARAFCPDPE